MNYKCMDGNDFGIPFCYCFLGVITLCWFIMSVLSSVLSLRVLCCVVLCCVVLCCVVFCSILFCYVVMKEWMTL
jgi:hypothetical protein